MILVFVLSTAIGAQSGEGGDTCEVWEVVANDNTCTTSACASSAPFSPPNCPNLYLICNSTSAHCKVTTTVYTYPGDQFVDRESNWDEQGCGGGPSWHEITLTLGAQYKLVTCFEACPTYACSECIGYVGQGRVSVNHP